MYLELETWLFVKMPLVVSGFGPFGNVAENPSSATLESLQGRSGLEVIQDVPVSISAVKSFPFKSSNTYIHFGVNESAEKLQIEKFAYNEARFRIADVDGVTVDGQKVSEGFPDRLETRPDVSGLLSVIGPDLAEASTDPGRYICNYLYFVSLANTGGNALFVHCPPYSVFSKEAQTETVKTIISFFS